VLVLVSAIKPSLCGWAKLMSGLKTMFGPALILSKKNAVFGFVKACLANASQEKLQALYFYFL
jgi:hypothetical protein